jgi:hypothetical protein
MGCDSHDDFVVASDFAVNAVIEHQLQQRMIFGIDDPIL